MHSTGEGQGFSIVMVGIKVQKPLVAKYCVEKKNHYLKVPRNMCIQALGDHVCVGWIKIIVWHQCVRAVSLE